MGRTVEELGKSLTALEFAEIMTVMPELAAQHPAMMAGGLVASVLANVNRGRDTPPFVPGDFLPDPWGEAEDGAPTAADFVAALNPTSPGPRHG